jgi:hypothetical protein
MPTTIPDPAAPLAVRRRYARATARRRPALADAMTTTETAPPAQIKKERLSTLQMLHLMRLEVDKSLRHHYALSCMVIGLDGLEAPSDRPHRKTLMPGS